MAEMRIIEQAFRNVLGDNAKGAFYVTDETDYGFIDGGDMTYVEAEIAKIENNDPILAQLEELDQYVARYAEDFVIAADTDSFLVEKANQKKQLRENLL